jgi:hypothetical protein
MEINTHVDKENGIVKVTMSCDEGTFHGIAKCLPKDEFDVERGTKIAYKRALLQVKQADIKQFRNELNKIEKQIHFLNRLQIEERRLKKHIKKAKKQLSNIYKEIETLSNEETNETKVTTKKESLKGRFFKKVNTKKDGNKTYIRKIYLAVADELSNNKLKVYLFKSLSLEVGNGYSQHQTSFNLDFKTDKYIQNMLEISQEEFETAIGDYIEVFGNSNEIFSLF